MGHVWIYKAFGFYFISTKGVEVLQFCEEVWLLENIVKQQTQELNLIIIYSTIVVELVEICNNTLYFLYSVTVTSGSFLLTGQPLLALED